MAISRMQQPRQLYGLGSLVKKAVRGVKKIAKSPLGKAALLYAGTAGLGALGGGGFKGLGWLKPSQVMSNWGSSGILGKLRSGKNMLGGFGNMFRQDPTKGVDSKFSMGKMLMGGLGATALAAPFLMGKEDEEDIVEESWTQVPSSIGAIRDQAKAFYGNPSASTLAFMPNKQFVDSNWYAADGGRARLAPGGPAGGASAGGNYGGNVNPDQEYAGSTFEERYGGGNNTNNTVVVNDTVTEPVINEGYNWKNILPGGQPFYASKYTDYENFFGTKYDPITGEAITEDDSELVDNIRNAPDLKNKISTTNEILANMEANESTLAQGGRVGLLNGGEAGQEQIEQMLMAEFVKYKNQGGTLSFEQFVQAVMEAQQQQPEGAGMEQPQEVAMAANGGRIGYKFGEMVEGIEAIEGSDENMLMAGMGNVMRLFENYDGSFDKAGFEDMMIQYSDSGAKRKGIKLMDFAVDFLGISSMKDGGRIGAYKGGLMREDEDEYNYNPQAAMRMYRRPGKQEGGIMETEEAEEMIDMGGQEKDYRETGGFVEIGGKERADDVPARLSKNEFVFTADAVRAAGGGDIDKGSEVMQNMMENLEAGGEISEESQGLEGAQAMYDQQQMLQSRIA